MQMWLKKPVDVELKLNVGSRTPPSLPQGLQGQTVAGTTPVTPQMSVQLQGSAGLDVQPSAAIRQNISDLSPTSWKWKVTPVSSDSVQLLTLTVFIHLDDKGPYTLQTYEDKIIVSVTSWQRIKAAVADIKPVWAFVAGAVPAIWGAYVWIRRRRSPLPPPMAD
jgi:hypothetical protein